MLHDHRLTRHAETRMRQRGLRDDDLRLILATATRVSSDAYLLTRKDVEREVAIRKQEIKRLERLESWKIVVVGNAVVTCFPAEGAAQKRARK